MFSPATSSYKHDRDVRAGAHSDYGSITLLFQRPGQPGLEILTPEKTWAPVPVQPGEMRASRGTFVISVITSPAPPSARER